MPKLLAVIPHPDDESYSFGGTIALAARAGWECRAAAVTSGEQGELNGHPSDPATMGPIRERELAQSCSELGALPAAFWRWPDGVLEELDGRDEIRKLLDREHPDIVLSLGPDGVYGHPDHIAVQTWLGDVFAERREALPALLYAAFPRGLFIPQYDKCIDMLSDPRTPRRSELGVEPAHYTVSVQSVARTKLASIAAHASQLPGDVPQALFPPGIVDALLEVERFTDSRGEANPAVTEMLKSIAGLPAVEF